ncbi:MAG: VWA domain-containing protein, partial [Planctomycetota bacterium]
MCTRTLPLLTALLAATLLAAPRASLLAAEQNPASQPQTIKPSSSANAGTSAKISFVERAHSDASASPITALGLRRTPASQQPAAHVDVVVLVDTSASQSGEFRDRTSQTLAGLLEKARDTDRFLLAAVDVDCVPLTQTFEAARGKPVQSAVLSLNARTPLGSTDMIAAINAAVEFFGDAPEPQASTSRAIIYIGDGPGLAGIETADFQQALEVLRSKRIPFSSVGIGSEVNWPCLAAIASATGGMLMVPDETVSVRDAGSVIGSLAIMPVTWPENVMLSSEVPSAGLRMLPARLPPLRGDRDSIVLIEGPLEGGRLEMHLADSRPVDTATPVHARGMQPMALDIPVATARSENAFLEELFRNARASDGVFLPLLGREGLELARGVIRGEAATLAALSRQAESAGAHDSAMRLADASLRRDPDNVDASLVRTVAQRGAPKRNGGPEMLPRPDAEDSTNAGASGNANQNPVLEATDQTELAEFNALRKVRAGQLEQETAVRLRNARQLMAADPDKARTDLKELQREVAASDDLDPAMRDRLSRQIQISVRESIVRSREKTERDLATERSRAIGRERQRLNSELQRKEDRIKQLTERYNVLVEEGIRVGYQEPTATFSEAERVVAKEIVETAPGIYANQGVPMTARVIGRTAPLVARILDYDAENTRVRRDVERGFMDALHLVDVAGIPFDDEPPIVYPNAKKWRELTDLR